MEEVETTLFWFWRDFERSIRVQINRIIFSIFMEIRAYVFLYLAINEPLKYHKRHI
jgi:hypothetical protein